MPEKSITETIKPAPTVTPELIRVREDLKISRAQVKEIKRSRGA